MPSVGMLNLSTRYTFICEFTLFANFYILHLKKNAYISPKSQRFIDDRGLLEENLRKETKLDVCLNKNILSSQSTTK